MTILLWTHLSASLEVLELQRFKYSDNLPPLPPCPRLHTFLYAPTTMPSVLPERWFHEFINSCPKITRVTTSGAFPHPLQIDMFPCTLRYLYVHHDLLYFNSSNAQFPGLISFRITRLEDHFTVPVVLSIAKYINSHFPKLLRLELEISWAKKIHALALARLVHSVRTLHLVIRTIFGLKAGANSPYWRPGDTDISGLTLSVRSSPYNCSGLVSKSHSILGRLMTPPPPF